MKVQLPKFNKAKPVKDRHIYIIAIILILLVISTFFSASKISGLQSLIASLKNEVTSLTQEKDKNLTELEKIGKELDEMKNQDQVKKNNELQTQIQNIEKTYDKAVDIYEDLLDLKAKIKDSKTFDNLFAKALADLSKRDFGAADAGLNDLANKIKEEETKIAASFTIPANVPESNTAPGGGYSRQQVQADSATFLVNIIAADLASTRVIVDTASDSDCSNNCPTLPLATYVSRSGGFAGIHGAYACPAEYPSCAGKTNSFDLLIMNKNKYYFNSGNNVYSTNPAVIFGNGWIRFVAHASEWGRDTSVDGVLTNFPLLVFNNNITYSEPGDSKMSIRSSRGFVANKGNTVYVGVVSNATVSESAKVLKALGMENAMNLDGGGSTALWYGGYKAGPGRNLTNAIILTKK
ncbi:MAG: copper amine oxidase domain protein [Microgenomates group bacterium GW2011_GWC1_37_8]|uniref:Copper amine oxidase domain protein n=1 Tax=Candidatus Woesebacteria bacterium GW2011_GWB1_38_8 TaxID=1618570 RepID=A0A0G0L9S7_9BACT|nr:MAG: copper amine oxidase domain protein [Microgenomates group bacterium GW2011_GWC1_37_8]KKQ84595.1 MAG: Copper amine oxidase domain protein [Candidatus Woesebacteria bacterium GW2011_GWB1_38_8]